MQFIYTFVGIVFGSAMAGLCNGDNMLFDFTKMDNLAGWEESSDTVRSVGMSKATLTFHRTQVFQRVIFFSLLNPQPNGAAFAGMRIALNWDLSSSKELRIRCRGRGENSHYKIVLRHKGKSASDDISYEQFFVAPMASDANSKLSDVVLPLADFKPYFRGKEVKDAEPLDLKQISMFGFQIHGGVYLPVKQSGASALEIESIQSR